RKILRRFEKEGEEGLKNKSRRPKNSPRKTSAQVEKVVVDIFVSGELPRSSKEGVLLSPTARFGRF
ncbi:MAG: leucine zipper domain-containing protein, partial [candidate division WOR-3 bacterium]